MSLQKEMGQLKLLDVHASARDIMCARQKLFECRDKPYCLQACLVGEQLEHRWVFKMRRIDGTMTMDTKEKLGISEDYYKILYTSLNPLREQINNFGG